MVLSDTDWLRWKVGRMIGVSDLLMLLVWLAGAGMVVSVFRGWFWLAAAGFAALPVLMLLLHFNFNLYFRGGG